MPTYYNFGHAIGLLKDGGKVSRKGWNGKGMWLVLIEPTGKAIDEDTGEQFEELPYIAMKTADDKVVPWLASQTDVLAEDWVLV